MWRAGCDENGKTTVRITDTKQAAGMKKTFNWLEEARRIADAEVERATGEFLRGEDVRYPCYATFLSGNNRYEMNGGMRVLYPAGKPVVGMLSTKDVEEPPTGRTRYFINAWIPRECVKLDIEKMRERARSNAEIMAGLEQQQKYSAPEKLPKLVRMALWNGCLRADFAKYFSDAAKACPKKHETFITHRHLGKTPDGEWRSLW